MEEIIQLNSGAKLSPHFTLGEMTKSSSHPEVYNVPSHEAIENMKRLQKDGAIEKCGEIIENGGKKFVYKKKGALIF